MSSIESLTILQRKRKTEDSLDIYASEKKSKIICEDGELPPLNHQTTKLVRPLLPLANVEEEKFEEKPLVSCKN